MTVFQPAGAVPVPPSPFPHFPQLLCLPERHTLSGGELLLFRFGNGYGAAVTFAHDGNGDENDAGTAFEFCVLDCTLEPPQPTFATPVAPQPPRRLGHAQVAQLLAESEGLPPHPTLERADAALRELEF